MGTPGLLGFFILGRRRSTYNHCDGYPEGLGRDIVDFILSLTPEDYSTMARLVTEITWVEWRSKPSPELQERYQKLGFTDLSVSHQSSEEWYCILHKMQGAIWTQPYARIKWVFYENMSLFPLHLHYG